MQMMATTRTDSTTCPPEDAASPADAFDRLLMRHKTAIRAQGIDRPVEQLKRYIRLSHDTYAAPAETGDAWLAHICDCLRMTLDARQRLEEEGTAPFGRTQSGKNEVLAATIGRLEKILNRGSAEILSLPSA